MSLVRESRSWWSCFLLPARQLDELLYRAPVTSGHIDRDEPADASSELRCAKTLRCIEIEHLVLERELLARLFHLVHLIHVELLRSRCKEEQMQALVVLVRLG